MPTIAEIRAQFPSTQGKTDLQIVEAYSQNLGQSMDTIAYELGIELPKIKGNTGAAWESGKAGYKAGFGNIAAAVGEKAGLKGVQTYGENLRDDMGITQQYADSKNTDPNNFDDVHGVADFGGYVRSGALKSTPYIAEAIAFAAADGITGGALTPTILQTYAARAAARFGAKGIAKNAAALGASNRLTQAAATELATQQAGRGLARTAMMPVVTAPSSLGDVLGNQYEEAGKYDLNSALPAAAGYAALNAVGLEGALARGMPVSMLKSRTARAASGAATLGVQGAAQETAQEVMNQAGRMGVNPDATLTSGDAVQRYKESAILGGILEGAPAAVTGAISKSPAAKNAATAAALSANQDVDLLDAEQENRSRFPADPKYVREMMDAATVPGAPAQEVIDSVNGITTPRPSQAGAKEAFRAKLQNPVVLPDENGKAFTTNDAYHQYLYDNNIPIPADKNLKYTDKTPAEVAETPAPTLGENGTLNTAFIETLPGVGKVAHATRKWLMATAEGKTPQEFIEAVGSSDLTEARGKVFEAVLAAFPQEQTVPTETTAVAEPVIENTGIDFAKIAGQLAPQQKKIFEVLVSASQNFEMDDIISGDGKLQYQNIAEKAGLKDRGAAQAAINQTIKKISKLAGVDVKQFLADRTKAVRKTEASGIDNIGLSPAKQASVVGNADVFGNEEESIDPSMGVIKSVGATDTDLSSVTSNNTRAQDEVMKQGTELLNEAGALERGSVKVPEGDVAPNENAIKAAAASRQALINELLADPESRNALLDWDVPGIKIEEFTPDVMIRYLAGYKELVESEGFLEATGEHQNRSINELQNEVLEDLKNEQSKRDAGTVGQDDAGTARISSEKTAEVRTPAQTVPNQTGNSRGSNASEENASGGSGTRPAKTGTLSLKAKTETAVDAEIVSEKPKKAAPKVAKTSGVPLLDSLTTLAKDAKHGKTARSYLEDAKQGLDVEAEAQAWVEAVSVDDAVSEKTVDNINDLVASRSRNTSATLSGPSTRKVNIDGSTFVAAKMSTKAHPEVWDHLKAMYSQGYAEALKQLDGVYIMPSEADMDGAVHYNASTGTYSLYLNEDIISGKSALQDYVTLERTIYHEVAHVLDDVAYDQIYSSHPTLEASGTVGSELAKKFVSNDWVKKTFMYPMDAYYGLSGLELQSEIFPQIMSAYHNPKLKAGLLAHLPQAYMFAKEVHDEIRKNNALSGAVGSTTQIGSQSQPKTTGQGRTDGGQVYASFIGPNAKTFREYPHIDIGDGNARAELDSSKAEVNIDDRRKTESEYQDYPADKLYVRLHFPELFKAYPALKDLPTTIKLYPKWMPDSANEAMFTTTFGGTHAVEVRAKSIPAIKSLLLHEIQHWIQTAEGWQAGGHQSKIGFDAYRNLFGEREARLVQARMGLTKSQRESTPAQVEEAKVYATRSRKAARQVGGISGQLAYDDAVEVIKSAGRGMMYLHDLVDEYKTKLPAIRDWYAALQNSLSTRKQLEGDAEQIATDAMNLKNGQDAVNAFISVSTYEQKWGYDPQIAGLKAVVDPAMRAKFVRLSAEEQKVVKDVFAHGYKMNKAKQEILKALGIQQEFTNTGVLEGPYAPLKRFGDFVAVLKSKELRAAEEAGDTKLTEKLKDSPDHYVVSYFDSKGQANLFAEQNEVANGGKFAWSDSFKKSVRTSEEQQMPQAVLAKVLAAVKVDDNMPAVAREAMKKLVTDMYFQSLDEHNARTSGLKRLNRAGYDADMIRSFLSHARAEAGFLANMKFGGEINTQFYKMQATAKDQASGKRVAQDEFNTIAEHYAESLKYKETPIQDRIMAMTSAWQLATSIGYHLTNALQGIMVTIPKLGADFNNYSGAWDHLMRGYGTLKVTGITGVPNLAAIKDVNIRNMLQKMSDIGLLDVGMDEDLTHFEATRTGIKPVDTTSKAARTALHLLRKVSRAVETANRISAAVAGYNMSIEAGKTIAEAQHYAERVLATTHGDVSRVGSPLLLKKLPKVVTQYRKYQFTMATLYVKAFRDAFMSEDAATKAIGKRMLAYKLFHTSVAAGVLGMPLANLVGMAFAALGDDDEPQDMERWLRDSIGDDDLATLLLHGPIALMGLDMSGKLGDNNVFSIMPYGEWDISSRAGLTQTAAGLAGPAVSQFGKFADGIGLITDGDYTKGIEKLMPKGIESGMKAFRIANEGYTLRNGDVMFDADGINGFALVMDFLGVPSSELKKMDFIRGQQYEISTFYKDRTTEIQHAYNKAYKAKDTAEMKELRDEWLALQKGKDTVRPYFNNARTAIKRQPLSNLLKYPQTVQKRSDKVESETPESDG